MIGTGSFGYRGGNTGLQPTDRLMLLDSLRCIGDDEDRSSCAAAGPDGAPPWQLPAHRRSMRSAEEEEAAEAERRRAGLMRLQARAAAVDVALPRPVKEDRQDKRLLQDNYPYLLLVDKDNLQRLLLRHRRQAVAPAA